MKKLLCGSIPLRSPAPRSAQSVWYRISWTFSSNLAVRWLTVHICKHGFDCFAARCRAQVLRPADRHFIRAAFEFLHGFGDESLERHSEAQHRLAGTAQFS